MTEWTPVLRRYDADQQLLVWLDPRTSDGRKPTVGSDLAIG